MKISLESTSLTSNCILTLFVSCEGTFLTRLKDITRFLRAVGVHSLPACLESHEAWSMYRDSWFPAYNYYKDVDFYKSTQI